MFDEVLFYIDTISWFQIKGVGYLLPLVGVRVSYPITSGRSALAFLDDHLKQREKISPQRGD